jgi:hypothetical protein
VKERQAIGSRKTKKEEKKRGEKKTENKGEQGKFSFIFSTVKIFTGTKIQGKEREPNAERKIQT